MIVIAVNSIVALIFGLAVGWYQGRNDVRMPFWFIVLYAVLFNVGLVLLETSLGIFN